MYWQNRKPILLCSSTLLSARLGARRNKQIQSQDAAISGDILEGLVVLPSYEILVLVIASAGSIAVEHLLRHVGPLHETDQRLHHLRHRWPEFWLSLKKIVPRLRCYLFTPCMFGFVCQICFRWLSEVLYLDTQGEHVSESGQRLGRVQALERRIHHPVQRIDVMELGRRPPHEWLLWPRLGAVTQTVTRSHLGS